MVVKIKLDNDQRDQVLYYETGFEQMHPYIHINDWMQEQGYRYQQDWRCYRQNHTRDQRSCYVLEFPNEEIQILFALKWL